jgi:hypothetical protein
VYDRSGVAQLQVQEGIDAGRDRSDGMLTVLTDRSRVVVAIAIESMANADSGRIGMLGIVMAVTMSRTRGRVGWRAAWAREARLRAEEVPSTQGKARQGKGLLVSSARV